MLYKTMVVYKTLNIYVLNKFLPFHFCTIYIQRIMHCILNPITQLHTFLNTFTVLRSLPSAQV